MMTAHLALDKSFLLRDPCGHLISSLLSYLVKLIMPLRFHPLMHYSFSINARKETIVCWSFLFGWCSWAYAFVCVCVCVFGRACHRHLKKSVSVRCSHVGFQRVSAFLMFCVLFFTFFFPFSVLPAACLYLSLFFTPFLLFFVRRFLCVL